MDAKLWLMRHALATMKSCFDFIPFAPNIIFECAKLESPPSERRAKNEDIIRLPAGALHLGLSL